MVDGDGDISSISIPAIRRAWNRATSASPERWSRANPALGQCAITALVIQDCIGGILVRTNAIEPGGADVSHYANAVGEHEVIYDLTESQFPEGTTFGPWEERERSYVLSFEETRKRYELLCRRIHEYRVIEQVAEMEVEA